MKITFSDHLKVHLSLLLPLLALLVSTIAGPIASVSAAPESISATSEASGLLPPLTTSVAAEDACRPGTGWRWTTGPALPETAAQVQQAFALVGIGSRVEATGFGETDSCGRFELAGTDFAITLDDPGLLEATAQAKLTATIPPFLRKFARPQLGNVRLTSSTGRTLVIPEGGESTPSQGLTLPSPSATVRTKKIYVLVYDPTLRNGQSLSAYMHWQSYRNLDLGVIDFFQGVSSIGVKYKIADTTVVTDQWPALIDGYRYTEPTYLAVLQGLSLAHTPSMLDYNRILDDPRFDICGKLNRGSIDEVWLWGGPYFGFWESTLAGPRAFWYNSPPVSGPNTCNQLVPIMGFSYERGLAEAVHDFGHRSESTMLQVYGSWHEDSTAHNWDRFALVRALSPDYAYSGCGSVHYPPNGQSDYDYGHPSTVQSNCDDFMNYPFLGDPPLMDRPVTCSFWDCTQLGYLTYWFGHLPTSDGCGPDMVGSDWWGYFADPNLALRPCSACRIEDEDMNIQYRWLAWGERCQGKWRHISHKLYPWRSSHFPFCGHHRHLGHLQGSGPG